MEEKIKKIIFDKFKVEVDNNTNLSELIEDSFAKIEMLFEIEQAVGTKLLENDIMNIETVGDLISVFEQKQ